MLRGHLLAGSVAALVLSCGEPSPDGPLNRIPPDVVPLAQGVVRAGEGRVLDATVDGELVRTGVANPEGNPELTVKIYRAPQVAGLEFANETVVSLSIERVPAPPLQRPVLIKQTPPSPFEPGIKVPLYATAPDTWQQTGDAARPVSDPKLSTEHTVWAFPADRLGQWALGIGTGQETSRPLVRIRASDGRELLPSEPLSFGGAVYLTDEEQRERDPAELEISIENGSAGVQRVRARIENDSGAFSLAPSEGCEVEPGESCPLQLSFAPQAEGSASADLLIQSDGTAGFDSTVLKLTGTAIKPLEVTVLPKPQDASDRPAIDFGPVAAGLSRDVTVQLNNTSAAAIGPLRTLLIGDSETFAVDGGCDRLLQANSQCSATLSFAPTALGSFRAHLQVSSPVQDGVGAYQPLISGEAIEPSEGFRVQSLLGDHVVFLVSFGAPEVPAGNSAVFHGVPFSVPFRITNGHDESYALECKAELVIAANGAPFESRIDVSGCAELGPGQTRDAVVKVDFNDKNFSGALTLTLAVSSKDGSKRGEAQVLIAPPL